MSTADLLGAYSNDDDKMDQDADGDEDSEPDDAINLMGDDTGEEDSSEEEDDDSDAEREVREGFIVDEDEASSRRRKKKRRKVKGDDEEGPRKRRKDSEDEGDLDEDDLALLEENTGIKLSNRSSKHKLKRLRRRRSGSAASDEPPAGINNIFDDDRDPVDAGELYDGDEMAGFIEDDTASDSSGRHGSDSEEDAAERRRAKQKKKKNKVAEKAARRSGFAASMVEGITAEAWSEVTEVFGNGHDYWEALEADTEHKEDKMLKDVFEPSEIASRMLTAEDDFIRSLDIPERMQLTSVGLPSFPPLEDGQPAPYIPEEELDNAVQWMSTRISPQATEVFLVKEANGSFPPLHDEFLAAVKSAVKFINVEFLEVPFIWAHRADYFVHFNPNARDPTERQIPLLEQAALWRIAAQSIKYRAFLNRKSDLRALFDQINVEDDYFETMFTEIETVEDVADVHDWLGMKYSFEIAQLKSQKEPVDGPVRMKRATRESRYESTKRNLVSSIPGRISISAAELSNAFLNGEKPAEFEEPLAMPLALAGEYTSGEFSSPEAALAAAEFILVHEISHDPMLRKEVRRYFKEYAVVTVAPTDKGKAKIDEMHPYYAFKYLRPKDNHIFLRSHQFLQIMAAEKEGLVISQVFLPPAAETKLLTDLKKLFRSDYTSSVAEAWNEVRDRIIDEAVKRHLVPAAEVWARNFVQDEEEEYIGDLCYRGLLTRVNVAPYCRSDGTMQLGETPSVLAISNGAGDPKRDSTVAVFIDSDGNLREHLKMDNFYPSAEQGTGDVAQRDSFMDLLKRRRPQVIVGGGFSPNTKRLMGDIQLVADQVSLQIVTEGDDEDEDEDEPLSPDQRQSRARFDTIFVFDDVARIFQSSKRAALEFPELSALGKYCVALARYAQSPLNEYAALGPDLVALSHHPLQKLLSKEKVLPYLERALVDTVNLVGVDVNRATRNPYYFHLLPYVSGLGPRKASAIVQKINGALGGTLSSRNQLITGEVVLKNVFLNVAAFLRIPQDDITADLKRPSDEDEDEDGGPDILDDTRIHPEDYDVARKMAADAMEYDEEDIQALKTPSQAVADVMEDDPKKLDDLSLDDFASELAKILGVPKRLTLYRIRAEMQGPYRENRYPFAQPTAFDVFTMLTGETSATLSQGLIVPVRVLRVRQDDAVLVRLDSGINGTINAGFRTESREDPANLPKPRPGDTLQAMVIDLHHDSLEVGLSTQESLIAAGDAQHRRVLPDPYFDTAAEAQDQQTLQQQQKGSRGRLQRMIKHPNFHNFTAGEAEEFLTHQARGECVVRPSSKEDHLAVTWKVDEGIFQHIAVFEMNKRDEFSIGSPLRIGKYSYVELDELIHTHIKQMAKKVEEMLAHEKCKGTQEQLNLYLQNFTMANPNQSAYGFGLNKSKPGEFVVSFRTNQKAEIQSWPVKVLPGAYSLLGEEHGDVLALCNAFKTLYLSRSSSSTGARLPTGRTPHHIGRTPNPYAGRTPNPYGGASPAVFGAGGLTPGRMGDPSGSRSPFPGASARHIQAPTTLPGGATPLHYPPATGAGYR